MEKVKVVLYGLGAMGSSIAKFLLEKEGVEIVGAIDVAEDKVGEDLGEILGLDKQWALQYRMIQTPFFPARARAEEYDSISVHGVPSLHMKIAPCINGDIGTVAIIVSSIPKVLKAPPGLVTMKDLLIPSAVLKDMRKYIHQ